MHLLHTQALHGIPFLFGRLISSPINTLHEIRDVQLDASLTHVLCLLGSGSFIAIQFGHWLTKFHLERPTIEMTKKPWSKTAIMTISKRKA